MKNCAQRLRVLLVDDEPLLRRTIAALLGREHDIVEASNGKEALGILLAGPPFDAILCDFAMPDMCGADLYEELRVQMPEMTRHFALLTGGAFTSTVKRLMETEHLVVLLKPCGRHELLDTIADLADKERPPRSAGLRGHSCN